MVKIKTSKLKIRGLKTVWLEAGLKQKPFMVFLHGFPDDASIWQKQIEYFSENFHVIAPMLRGIGMSQASSNKQRYRLNSVSLDILAILKSLDPSGKKDIFLVGHDIGSAHAWALSFLLKERLKGLVIINGAEFKQYFSRLGLSRQTLKAWYLPVMNMPLIPEILFSLYGKKILNFAYENGGIKIDNKKEITQKLIHIPEYLKHYRQLSRDFFSELIRFENKKLERPVLALSSTNDPYLEPANLSEIKKLSQHPVVRIIEGGHWVYRESPHRVNQLISSFIEKECA